jgi:hypothetical protein
MNTPSRKVTAGALAGALSVVLVYVVRASSGVDIPGEVGSAITTILTFGVSYFVND